MNGEQTMEDKIEYKSKTGHFWIGLRNGSTSPHPEPSAAASNTAVHVVRPRRNQAAGTPHEPKEKRNPPFWTATIPHTRPGRPDGRPTGECGTRPFWARPSRFASCNLRTGRQGPARPSPWYGDATPSDQAKASGRTGIGAIILPAAGRPCGCGWSRPSNRAGGATHPYARRPPPTLRRDADPCQWTRRIGRNEAKPDLQSTKVTRAEWKRNGYGGLHVYGNRLIGHFPLVSQ